MQRALRMCAESAKLWAEYFRMELLYAAKLHTRRKVLGLEAGAGGRLAAAGGFLSFRGWRPTCWGIGCSLNTGQQRGCA